MGKQENRRGVDTWEQDVCQLDNYSTCRQEKWRFNQQLSSKSDVRHYLSNVLKTCSSLRFVQHKIITQYWGVGRGLQEKNGEGNMYRTCTNVCQMTCPNIHVHVLYNMVVGVVVSHIKQCMQVVNYNLKLVIFFFPESYVKKIKTLLNYFSSHLLH